MSRPRVLIADDHLMFAEGLRGLLEPEFEVVGVVADGPELVSAAVDRRPDVIVADVTMTTLGGIGHTLPYLIPDFRIATGLAVVIVLIELWAIAWIRARYMDTPFLRAAFQVVIGGLLVFLTGILIGSA